MKALVSGGTGVLGAAVARALLEAGDEIVVLSSRGELGRLGNDVRHITSVVCDLRDTPTVEQVLTEHRPDCVVHLAALLPATAERDVLTAIDVNVRCTVSLWNEAFRVDASRFVYASTKSVYGPPPAGLNPASERHLDEHEPTFPVSIYGATKLAGETILHAQSRLGGPLVVALRFATILAPAKGQQHRASAHSQTAVLSDMLDAAVAGRNFHIERGADQIDDMIYVEDAARGVAAAAHAPQPREAIYHIATGVPHTPRELVETANLLFGDQSRVTIGPGFEYMGPDAIYGVMSTDRARRDLGFSAEDNLERTLWRYRALAEQMGLVQA